MAAPLAPVVSLQEHVFNHLALPPRLPVKQESQLLDIQKSVLEHVLQACKDLTNHGVDGKWDTLRRHLETCKLLNFNGTLHKTSLLKEFRSLQSNDLIILHINAQNAGLLLRRCQHDEGDCVLFETFEASPSSGEVLAAKHALQWDFPGYAVAVPFATFEQPSFQDELASFLEQASVEPIQRFAAQTMKAGHSLSEIRDIVDPSLIAGVLMTILETNGTRCFVPLTRKRVVDDVCWLEGSQKPWRRCAFWLVLRVAIQRYLATVMNGEVGRIHYKFLMCLVLANLLDDSLVHLEPEKLAFLKSKLCRRLVKLENDRFDAPVSLARVFDHLFSQLGGKFEYSLKEASKTIDTAWSVFKLNNQKQIPYLPQRAQDQDLRLTLASSGKYLSDVLTEYQDSYNMPLSGHSYQSLDFKPSVPERAHAFAERYTQLSYLESSIAQEYESIPSLDCDYNERISKLVARVTSYLASTVGAYDYNSEGNSIRILTTMELWMSVDKCACKAFPLLHQYNPVFNAEILGFLQLSRLEDMERLHRIRIYLLRREVEAHTSLTIFAPPVKGCFAEQYFDSSDKMQELRKKIEAVAAERRDVKEAECRALSEEYVDLTKKIAESTCLGTFDEYGRRQHYTHCARCYHVRESKRLFILVHEHPLPEDEIQAKTAVFELASPRTFLDYRDVTWKIISTLAISKKLESNDPAKILLRDYSELRDYTPRASNTLVLASSTKSHIGTHYVSCPFPASLRHVCVANGLTLDYFDNAKDNKSWPNKQKKAVQLFFAHHCPLQVPSNSPLASYVNFSTDFTPGAEGPSSYKIVANQTRCPGGVNVHEFTAFQTLFAGKARRWQQILLELGSSNLNFGTATTTSLMSLLALQAGPVHESGVLGIVHGIFRNRLFCQRLSEQLSLHLATISSNWRETQGMETMITLILRLGALGDNFGMEARRLLESARSITSAWMTALNLEHHKAKDVATSKRYSQHALWAALLCRRTFLMADNEVTLDSIALQYFIQASITLQDNMVSDPTKLPLYLKNAFVRDLKHTCNHYSLLRRSLEADPSSLLQSIAKVWPGLSDLSPKSYHNASFRSGDKKWWFEMMVNSYKGASMQTVHFNLLEGNLLVEGKLVGKLPVDYLSDPIFADLFGSHSLLTYPSPIPGMTYQLAVDLEGYQVHLGVREIDVRNTNDRKTSVVVRACKNDTVLEFVPRKNFKGTQSFDMPSSLIEDRYHWLDLRSGIIEIREFPNIWRSQEHHWRLNLKTRRVSRHYLNEDLTLVNPQAPLFHNISRIFDGFEIPYELTIFQPLRGALRVQLQRLALSFHVNPDKLLQCTQLRSEIDPDQDAGTWFGLKSKLVLRELISDPRDLPSRRNRSIIVPLGSMRYVRQGPHVIVNVENSGDYGRYVINHVLGRLDCPAEPRLLYLKALLHACTSFVFPDPLTGRTGTEEAVHCLESGHSQPWQPLKVEYGRILMEIARLTPRREYYPEGLKVMQQTHWDPHLTVTIQHDALKSIVEAIYAKSNRLSLFAMSKVELPSLPSGGDTYLTSRSCQRRNKYQRPRETSAADEATSDVVYTARDRPRASIESTNVATCVTLLREWPSKFRTSSDLGGTFSTWPMIGGFKETFEKVLLSDLLEIDLPVEWGSLVNFCRSTKAGDVYKLMFLLGIIAFNSSVDMDSVRVLVAFAVFPILKDVQIPQWPSYDRFSKGAFPRVEELVHMLQTHLIPYPGDDRSSLYVQLTWHQRRKLQLEEKEYEDRQQADAKALAEFLAAQWPCDAPTIGDFPDTDLLDLTQVLDTIQPEWTRLVRNLEYSEYTDRIQQILKEHSADEDVQTPEPELKQQELFPTRIPQPQLPTLSHDLMCKPGPEISQNECQPLIVNNSAAVRTVALVADVSLSPSSESLELQNIVETFARSSNTVRQEYGADLLQSVLALRKVKKIGKKDDKSIDLKHLSQAISEAERVVRNRFKLLETALEKDDSRTLWLKYGTLWPSVTTVSLLEKLRSTCTCNFGTGMREGLLSYALSITTLQRLLRIERAHQGRNSQSLSEELNHLGHENWNPGNHCDWLLLEIDSNVLIRRRQVEVANATIRPITQSNSVLQMNMGQGKTSCIIPMAAAVLANGKSLHRVIVPKALLLQTAQLLQARLGGLLGRELRHIPFSRKTSTSTATIHTYRSLHKEIQTSAGVIIALPEHLLSFKLSGLQRLLDTRIPEATEMIKVQDWLTHDSRDVLDECDFTLAVKTQLIYPSGPQKTVDGHPIRWEAVEELLRMVESQVEKLKVDFPQSLKVIRRSKGGFPIIHFLRQDAEDVLLARLVENICSGQTSILPGQWTKSDASAIMKFIAEEKVAKTVSQHIRQLFPDRPAAKKVIYLLRGLLVYRILIMALKKRWNVQYGLDPRRDPIAVPFSAKGNPSEMAEWGHPDVAILLTCLSFYYEGLETAQVRQALESVLKSDDPCQVYDRFCQASDIPDSLRDWKAINIDDDAQMLDICKYVGHSMVVIDYYLNNFVFPRHAKQFEVKLQTSGWDISLYALSTGSQTSKPLSHTDRCLTTGFSGTNDWKRMLPLTTHQNDLQGLLHTNANVLTTLLEERNRTYVLAANEVSGDRWTEENLLLQLKNEKIRVLIDAGAQVLEMDNLGLVQAWLQIWPDAPAAVYFDKFQIPMVWYQNGHQVPLAASPFAEGLGDCLVYLDEAHTRGTDLKLPPNARGALTLGLGQTKDHTVQAAMRLRQLATTQVVTFFAPPEVHQSILDVRKTVAGKDIDSHDVICWLLEQTCIGIEQLQPLYYSQGVDFCRRAQAALDNPKYLTEFNQRQNYVHALRQAEQQSLEQLYGVGLKSTATGAIMESLSRTQSPQILSFVENLTARRIAFQDCGVAVHGSALQEVEQEREVAYEVEAVREVERPVYYDPLLFPGMHQDIVFFAKNGHLPKRFNADSRPYEQAFAFLQGTAIGRKFGISDKATSSKLFLSREFTRTVKLPLDRSYDNFQRQVQWILWSPSCETAMIVIPEEAEELLFMLRRTTEPLTHLLLYSAPVTRKMLHFSRLKFFAEPSLADDWEAPAWLRVELGILAGRLYFEYSEYSEICRYLGVKESDSKIDDGLDDSSIESDVTGDAAPDGPGLADEMVRTNVFAKKPLSFLQEWLSVKRKGQDFTHTPMGYVCQGKPLVESHAFFSKAEEYEEMNVAKVDIESMEAGSCGDVSDCEEDVFDMEGIGADVDGEDTLDESQPIDEGPDIALADEVI